MMISDRLLFLKYALPCAGTLVNRGNVTREYVDRIVEMVSNGEVPKENAEEAFKVANAMCKVVAERMDRNSIDSDVIRTYFLLEHSDVVDDRYGLMKDFNPVECKTYLGTVVERNDGTAVVETRLGKKAYKTAFAKDVKAGDRVIVHWNYVIEKAPDGFSERMGQGSA